jgi:small-conductance mechanosensitive channel
LKDEFRRIKPAIRVSEADVANAKQELAGKRSKHLAMQDVYRQRLGVVLADKQEKGNTLEILSKRFNIPLNADLDAWRVEPQPTVTSYLGICQVGALNSYILLLETKRRLLDLQSTIETVISNNEAIQVQVKESFHKLSSGAFTSEDAIAQEIKKYDAPKSEAKANITLYRTEIQNIDEQLEGQKKILDIIAQLRKTIQDNQSRIFKHTGKEYLTCIEMLARAERSVKERIDLLKQLSSIYTEGIDTADRTIRQINFIIAELNTITIWYRPEYAISWEGVKRIVTDIEVFLNDVMIYIQRINVESIMGTIQDTIESPFNLLFVLFKLLILVVALFLIRLYVPAVTAFLMRVTTSDRSGIFRVLSMILVVLLKFMYTYFISITIWVVFLTAIMTQFVLDPYIYILFYLGSIPYLLVLSNCFIRFMTTFNKKENYPILSQEFERRFMLVFSTLLYATIAIFLFREAFEVFRWIKDYQSELASILFAINYIIFQISLIFLISKEQILNVLPEKNNFSLWLREQVDRYYAFLLLAVITIIVMINPYVGFGSLVWYMLKGIFLTGLLVAGLFWLYGLFKNAASRVFFARDDEIVRERFPHAKTWFGLLIITLFLCVAVLGIIFSAYIWGWPLGLKDVGGWLAEPLIPGLTPPITVMSLLKLITFVLGGLLVSYALDRFVLDKIFDLLLVDMGVQHTVTSIARYLIVIATVFLGLQNVGLGNLVVWIVGALALGIGWILKEPISDFVGYFIILVQRPLKIGDFIQIDENTLGVVRKITPRSIVLRRKNSTTIVVPNSYVINHAIVNWNYVRKFIAFNDIIILIHYAHDPARVLQLLMEAVESHPKVLKNPRPIVRLDEFGEYGYKFMARGFLSDVYTLEQWNIASDIRIIIVKKLEENGIEIAVPMRRYEGVVSPGRITQAASMPEGNGPKE